MLIAKECVFSRPRKRIYNKTLRSLFSVFGAQSQASKHEKSLIFGIQLSLAEQTFVSRDSKRLPHSVKLKGLFNFDIISEDIMATVLK